MLNCRTLLFSFFFTRVIYILRAWNCNIQCIPEGWSRIQAFCEDEHVAYNVFWGMIPPAGFLCGWVATVSDGILFITHYSFSFYRFSFPCYCFRFQNKYLKTCITDFFWAGLSSSWTLFSSYDNSEFGWLILKNL